MQRWLPLSDRQPQRDRLHQRYHHHHHHLCHRIFHNDNNIRDRDDDDDDDVSLLYDNDGINNHHHNPDVRWYDGSNGRGGNGSTTVAISIGVVALLVVGFAVNATLSKSSDTGDVHSTSYSFENPMYQNNKVSASSDSDDDESPGLFGATAGYIDVSGSGTSGSGAFYEDVPGFASTTATTSYMDVTGKPYGGAGGDEDTHGNGTYSDIRAASAAGYHGPIANGTYSDMSMGAADGYADVPGTNETSGYVEVESFGGDFEPGSASTESEEEV